MALRVYKFGGASLADIEKVQAVADFLKSEKLKYSEPILAVVSAMGKTTDELIALAKKISAHPQKRELDMLLSVGERTSMALMSLALNERSVPSISLTGSQAGILTDDTHGNARILDLRPIRLKDYFEKNLVVVLAGFQGVSARDKEITTLGRGGTDTTAVAMAAHFQSEVCEFKKDVGGVFSADPKIIPHAKHLPQLTHKNLLDMSFWGAKLLHYRAAELAHFLKLPLKFSHFQDEEQFTLVQSEAPMLEQQEVLGINSHKDLVELTFQGLNTSQALEKIRDYVKSQKLYVPQMISVLQKDKDTRVLLVGELGEPHHAENLKAKHRMLSSVTLTCQGSVSSELLFQVNEKIKGLANGEILQDTTNLTVIVEPAQREVVIQKLHELVS